MSAPAEVTSVQAQATKPSSRRALLGAGLGALAATVASALGRPAPVRAEGENIVVGGEYDTALSVTRLRNQTNDSAVFRAESGGGGTGVRGSSSSFVGVWGSSNSSNGVFGESISGDGVGGRSNSSSGVWGRSFATNQPAILGDSKGDSTGLLGFSGTGNPPAAAKAKTGVYGQATQDSSSRGVWGRANAGLGVRGDATSGTGLYGHATTGFALRTNGRLRHDKVSGVATIAAGSTSVTVTPGVNVTSNSFVLLTPRHNIGSRALWYVPNATTDKFNIRISSAMASNTRVAWLLVG